MMEDSQVRTPEGLTSNVPFVSGHTRALIVVVLFVAAYVPHMPLPPPIFNPPPPAA